MESTNGATIRRRTQWSARSANDGSPDHHHKIQPRHACTAVTWLIDDGDPGPLDRSNDRLNRRFRFDTASPTNTPNSINDKVDPEATPHL